MKPTLLGVALAAGLVGLQAVTAAGHAAAPAWAMNASVIEACSCTMFCQCYFNPRPTEHTAAPEHAGHGKGHFCKFNNVYKVNRGHHGATKLDGATFWIAGDLGADFSDGEMDWAVLHFTPEVSKAQRDGIVDVLGHLFPVRWKSFEIGKDAPIEWTASRDAAVATLDGGKAGEVRLKRMPGQHRRAHRGQEPAVLWRAQKRWFRDDAQRGRSLSSRPKGVRVQGHQRLHDHHRHRRRHGAGQGEDRNVAAAPEGPGPRTARGPGADLLQHLVEELLLQCRRLVVGLDEAQRACDRPDAVLGDELPELARRDGAFAGVVVRVRRVPPDAGGTSPEVSAAADSRPTPTRRGPSSPGPVSDTAALTSRVRRHANRRRGPICAASLFARSGQDPGPGRGSTRRSRGVSPTAPARRSARSLDCRRGR